MELVVQRPRIVAQHPLIDLLGLLGEVLLGDVIHAVEVLQRHEDEGEGSDLDQGQLHGYRGRVAN